MIEQIDSRELFALEGRFPTVRGTYQRPADGAFRTESGDVGCERVGVLFLNGLYANRSSNGDAAVYWASALAEQGYPSFRIDLPGFGDSGGDPPEDWLGYINAGGYAAVTAASIKEIVRRFGLSGLVIAGHCAGAVSAIYAAAESKECCGLVVMDPYFHLPKTETPQVRQRLNIWARKSRVGGFLSRMFALIKQVRLMVHRDGLPENANVPLLRCWKQVASAKLPILILKAPSRGASGTKPRVGEFDYSSHILRLAGPGSCVVVKVVDGANHSFSNARGRAAVQENINLWLNANFSLRERSHDLVSPIQHRETSKNNEGIGVTNIA